MPLQTNKAGDCRGTEADGTKSEKWCSLCFVNGAFVDPDCTVDKMIETVDTALRRDRAWGVMRYLAKKQVPRLERWR